MKLGIVCCLHGDERYGFEVSKNQSFFPFFLANKKAFIENKRFIDSDLNRSFPGKENGNHEEKLAFELTKKLKSFDYVLDLHSSSNECPIFGVITKPNNEKIEFAKKLGLKKLVIMKESFASGKALIDFVKCGISIEVGPHDRKENVEEAVQLIENFLNDKNRNENIEIFEVIDVIKKEADCITIKNFEYVKKGDLIAYDENNKQYAEFDFVPILVNENAYEGVLCLACAKGKVAGERLGKNVQ